MSISSMTNAAAARRSDVGVPNATPKGLSEIAAAATTPPESASPAKEEANTFNTALNVLFGYIPTEVVTLYVAVVAALQPAGTPGPGTALASPHALWVAFGGFLAVTPVAVWVVYASKLKAAGKPLPVQWGAVPAWEMCAASLAFAAWAFALPNTPFRDFTWFSPALASIAVLVMSTALGMLAPLFQRPLSS